MLACDAHHAASAFRFVLGAFAVSMFMAEALAIRYLMQFENSSIDRQEER